MWRRVFLCNVGHLNGFATSDFVAGPNVNVLFLRFSISYMADWPRYTALLGLARPHILRRVPSTRGLVMIGQVTRSIGLVTPTTRSRLVLRLSTPVSAVPDDESTTHEAESIPLEIDDLFVVDELTAHVSPTHARSSRSTRSLESGQTWWWWKGWRGAMGPSLGRFMSFCGGTT